MLGLDARFRVPPRAGAFLFHTPEVDGAEHFGISFRVVWERESGEESVLVFGVAESTEGFDRTIRGFRRSLWGWLGGLAAVLLVLQWAIMRWGLAPLRHVAEDLRSIESGERERLEGQYPLEIRRLTDNLNTLIARDEGRLERYRNAMGDLAHSLKTPLAVIKGIADKDAEPSGDAVQLGEQARRMNQIVEYQLQRASTSGKAALARAVQPQSLVDKLLATLVKVYADKAVQVTVDIPERTLFHGESGDLMELAGNLLDNAFKCCCSRIALRIRQVPEGQPSRASRPLGLDLQVDDDGPGIPDDMREVVLQRGVRADEAACGQGIGLAVVREIVEAYDGQLEIGSSEELGGARMSVFLPRG
jgi:two-component system sensor histidine kinase PhoQ